MHARSIGARPARCPATSNSRPWRTIPALSVQGENLSQSEIYIKYHEKEHFPKFSIWPFQNLTDSDNQQTISIQSR